MKKETAFKLSALLLIGLFLLPLTLNLVMAGPGDNNPDLIAGSDDKNFFEKVGDKGKEFFKGWMEGDISDWMKKLFITFVVFVVLFVLLLYIPVFSEHKGLAFILALVIGFFSTALFKIEEVNAIFEEYTALGLTLSVILPFIILMGLTFNAIRHVDSTLTVLSKLGWLFFGVFGIYRMFVFEGEKGAAFYVILISVVVSALFVFFWHIINKSLRETILEADIARYRDIHARSKAVINTNAEATHPT